MSVFELTYSIPEASVEKFMLFVSGIPNNRAQKKQLLREAAQDYWNEVLSVEEDWLDGWPMEIILHDKDGKEIARGRVDVEMQPHFDVLKMEDA